MKGELDITDDKGNRMTGYEQIGSDDKYRCEYQIRCWYESEN